MNLSEAATMHPVDKITYCLPRFAEGYPTFRGMGPRLAQSNNIQTVKALENLPALDGEPIFTTI